MKFSNLFIITLELTALDVARQNLNEECSRIFIANGIMIPDDEYSKCYQILLLMPQCIFISIGSNSTIT